MPGGGHLVTAGLVSTYHLNNRGDVSFAGKLDTGATATGLYVFSNGALSLVARTGTVIPGVGTIDYLGLAPLSLLPAGTGGVISESGEVLFFATLTDGTGVLLQASPKP